MAVYLNWKFVFELKSGKAMHLGLIWPSFICIWSQNVYLDTTLINLPLKCVGAYCIPKYFKLEESLYNMLDQSTTCGTVAP